MKKRIVTYQNLTTLLILISLYFIGGCTPSVESDSYFSDKTLSLAGPDAAFHFLAQQQDLFHRDFVVYDDRDSGGVHFFPSGWMGDLVNYNTETEELIIDDNCSTRPFRGLTCTKITYPIDLAQRGVKGWAGVFWQFPDKNWGSWRGYDLSHYCFHGEEIQLSFAARGETGEERIKFQAGGINRPLYFNSNFKFQDTFGPVKPNNSLRDGVLKLSRNWRLYSFDLTDKDLRNVIGPFCWVADNDLNPQGATFYLDEMRIRFGPQGRQRRLQEPRFIRSYMPLNSGGPDLYFRNVSCVYDNALAILAFLARGNADDLRRAKLLADAFVYVQKNDRKFHDGRLRNAYACGDISDPSQGDKARLPGWWGPVDASQRIENNAIERKYCWWEDEYFVGSDCGNMAWAIIALVSYWEKAGRPYNSDYIKAAENMGEWIVKKYSIQRSVAGYTGGVVGWASTECHTEGQEESKWKSTEHNIDIFVAFTRLANAENSETWKKRALHAKKFVDQMWDENKKHFWTGTTPNGVTPNKKPIPLDVHPWAILAMPDVEKYRAGIQWAKDNCLATSKGVSGLVGFEFKAYQNDDGGVKDPRGIWWEGTAQMVVAYKLLGMDKDAMNYLEALRKYSFGSGALSGIWACSTPECLTGFKREWGEWKYYRRQHVGATCWYIFAELGWNPYWSEAINPLK
jgi:hypothetical protein